ncbi:AraC family transcriptional regulator [Paraburkholderia sediminicola]|uniref:AraC family transcriptional regulator n=1 Tax=Paraburkholderia sediminicola TaxID=458836 RepID=UPI0038B89352
MEKRLISACWVEEALSCVRECHEPIEPSLTLAGIDLSAGGSRHEPVTAEQFGALWRAIAATLDDEFFGLGARPMRTGGFEMLCHSILHTASLEQALSIALEFLRLMLDEPRGKLVRANGQAQILLHEGNLKRPAFACRTYWIILHGIACWLVGRRIPLRRVDFSCPEPEHGEQYRLLFGAPVHFDQPLSRLTFDASLLRLPVVRDHRALKRFLRDAPANILVRYRYDAGVVSAIRRRLRDSQPVAWPRFDELSVQLKIPPTTLRRRLREEGQTYQAIRDEIRHELAITALTNTQRTVGDIAMDLGYAEPSAFHRAFRKWTSETPSEYRAANRHVRVFSDGRSG